VLFFPRPLRSSRLYLTIQSVKLLRTLPSILFTFSPSRLLDRYLFFTLQHRLFLPSFLFRFRLWILPTVMAQLSPPQPPCFFLLLSAPTLTPGINHVKFLPHAGDPSLPPLLLPGKPYRKNSPAGIFGFPCLPVGFPRKSFPLDVIGSRDMRLR